MEVTFLPIAEKRLNSFPDEIEEEIRGKLDGLKTAPTSPEEVCMIEIKGRYVFRLKLGGRGEWINHRVVFDIIDSEIVVLYVFDKSEEDYEDITFQS